ncbi:MAG: hypothetical protein GEU73_16275 [Chloroflexi bacterium]|nr:hypothetical protein [Chloroflexota bacterium]
MRDITDRQPDLSVEPAGCSPGIAADQWSVAWTVSNASDDELAITGAWLPHGQFRSPRRDFTPPLTIAVNERVRVEFLVRCREAPGTVVENAFVILTVEWQSQAWRIFARSRVRFDDSGAPQPATELITVQRVGFSTT